MNEFNRQLFHHALDLLVAPSTDQQSTKILTDMLEASKRPAILAVKPQSNTRFLSLTLLVNCST
jgi:hypothetical protein